MIIFYDVNQMKCIWSVTSTCIKCPQPVKINDLVVNLVEDAQLKY